MANSIILGAAGRDSERVADIIAMICRRLEAEGYSAEELHRAAEQLLQELSGRRR